MEKCDFWDVDQFCFSSQKKFVFYLGHHSALFLVLVWLKKANEKKNPFFDQKHGLTPLEKCDFWDVKQFCFSSQKKVVFYLGHHSTLFLVLVWLKTTNEKKNPFFDQKHGLNPLEKCDFWDVEKFCFCSQKKVCFLSRTSFNLISSIFLTENK